MLREEDIEQRSKAGVNMAVKAIAHETEMLDKLLQELAKKLSVVSRPQKEGATGQAGPAGGQSPLAQALNKTVLYIRACISRCNDILIRLDIAEEGD